MSWEVRLRDRFFAPVAVLYPLESGVQPTCISWSRSWQEAGEFSLVIPASTPYYANLMTLGSYIEIRNAETGAAEALYIIEHAELLDGIITYIRDTGEHSNAVYAAGQGTGTLRDVYVGTNTDSIAEIGRLEEFLDARDVEKDNFGLLQQRAEAKLGEIKQYGTMVANAGSPAQDETIAVSGRSLLFWYAKRIVLPPPATEAAGIIDITGADYDEYTGSPDVVMKHYVDNHVISPADGARTVANFVLGAALPPLADITFQSRFGTVLDALQEICFLNNCGIEVYLNAADEFEFQVLRQTDRTVGSGTPVVFYSKEALVSVPGRAYRVNWDVGDLVTLVMEGFGGLQYSRAILQVAITLEPEAAEKIDVAFDTPVTSDLERFRQAILAGNRSNIVAARA